MRTKKVSECRWGSVSELQLVGLISRMFGGQNTPNTFAALAEALDESDVFIGPFKLSHAQFICDRLPVLEQIRKPSRSQLLMHLEEAPSCPLIVADATIPGQDGIFVVMLVHKVKGSSAFTAWLSGMKHNVQFMAGSHDEHLIFAAPLASFSVL